jgi:hypothetical protein
MIKGTRFPVLPAALRFQPPHTKSLNRGLRLESDPWRAVCEFCRLPDCILPEGGPGGYGGKVSRYEACPIIIAQRDGLTPAAALARAKEETNG